MSEREREVLQHVARGYSYKEIGERLFISPKTVENHVRNILDKLHLNRKQELIRYDARTRHRIGVALLIIIFIAAFFTTGVLAGRNVLPQPVKIVGVVVAIIFILLASVLILVAIAGGAQR